MSNSAKRTFEVTLEREEIHSCTVTVEASGQDEAEELAIEQACEGKHERRIERGFDSCNWSASAQEVIS